MLGGPADLARVAAATGAEHVIVAYTAERDRALRGRSRLDDRVRWDNCYIENWSLRLDARILLRTLAALRRGAG